MWIEWSGTEVEVLIYLVIRLAVLLGHTYVLMSAGLSSFSLSSQHLISLQSKKQKKKKRKEKQSDHTKDKGESF